MVSHPLNLTPVMTGSHDLGAVAVLLDPSDHVAIVKVPLAPGTVLSGGGGHGAVWQMIPEGHKVSPAALCVR